LCLPFLCCPPPRFSLIRSKAAALVVLRLFFCFTPLPRWAVYSLFPASPRPMVPVHANTPPVHFAPLVRLVDELVFPYSRCRNVVPPHFQAPTRNVFRPSPLFYTLSFKVLFFPPRSPLLATDRKRTLASLPQRISSPHLFRLYHQFLFSLVALAGRLFPASRQNLGGFGGPRSRCAPCLVFSFFSPLWRPVVFGSDVVTPICVSTASCNSRLPLQLPPFPVLQPKFFPLALLRFVSEIILIFFGEVFPLPPFFIFSRLDSLAIFPVIFFDFCSNWQCRPLPPPMRMVPLSPPYRKRFGGNFLFPYHRLHIPVVDFPSFGLHSLLFVLPPLWPSPEGFAPIYPFFPHFVRDSFFDQNLHWWPRFSLTLAVFCPSSSPLSPFD